MRARVSLLAAFFACAQERSAPPSPVAPSSAKLAPPAVTMPIKTEAVYIPEGVVVEAATEAVYLMTEAREIEARDLKTGAVRWRSALAERPLWVFGERLLAQTGNNRVILLNAADGARSPCALDASITLPPIQRGLASRSTILVTEVEGKVAISWTYTATRQDGAQGDDSAARTIVDESGVVVVVPGRCKAYRSGSVPEPEEPTTMPAPQIQRREAVDAQTEGIAVGDWLLWVQDRQVRVKSLSDAARHWEAGLRDVSFRGR